MLDTLSSLNHKQPPIRRAFRCLTKPSPQPATPHESLAQLSKSSPACFLTIIAPSSLPTLFPPDSVSFCHSPRGHALVYLQDLACASRFAWKSHFHSRAQWSEGKHSKTCVYFCVSWINEKIFLKYNTAMYELIIEHIYKEQVLKY